MACFLVPVAEAVVTTAAAKVLKTKEPSEKKLSFATKLGWLSKLLWGGSALLCFEHVWHGEIVPFAPFLTAAADPESKAIMLREMAAVGGSMAILLTAVWAVMLLVAHRAERKALQPTVE